MILSSDVERGCDKKRDVLPDVQTGCSIHEKTSSGQTLSCCRKSAKDKPIFLIFTD